MNREDRVRRVIPGATDELVAVLAAKPVAEVDVIVAALRQARRDALDHDKETRRQRKADSKAHRWYDEAELAGRNVRMLQAHGKRASADLAALQTLQALTRQADTMLRLAVDGLRAQGVSDGQIGSTLGISRQAVGQRFGRKGNVHTEEARSA